MRKQVIVIGDACIDIHIRLADYLNEDSTKQMPYQAILGGTIANTAISLNRLNVDVAFLGTVGNDYAGKQIIEKLKEHNIDSSLTLVNNELNTINVFALIDDSGERHLWGYPRVDVAYADLNINKVDLNRIKNASWIHSSGMTVLGNGSLQENLPELFKLAYENGVETSFDFNTRVNDKSLLNPRAVESIEKLLPYVKYLTGSFEEFMSFYPSETIEDCLKYFVSQGKVCIARNGKEGFICINNDTIYKGQSYNVKVLDSTGAGDNFNAGFIAAMLEGKDIEQACEFANGTAAYKISHEDLIDKNKIEELISKGEKI